MMSMTCSSSLELKADVRIAFPPLVNDKASVKFIADVAAEIVGEENMNREGPFVMASEDFSYMLEKVPGAFINIGNGGGEAAARSTIRATTSTTTSSRWAPPCCRASSRGSCRRTHGDAPHG